MQEKTSSPNKPKLLRSSVQNLLSFPLLSPSPSNIPVGRGSVIGAACLTAIIFSTQIHWLLFHVFFGPTPFESSWSCLNLNSWRQCVTLLSFLGFTSRRQWWYVHTQSPSWSVCLSVPLSGGPLSVYCQMCPKGTQHDFRVCLQQMYKGGRDHHFSKLFSKREFWLLWWQRKKGSSLL